MRSNILKALFVLVAVCGFIFATSENANAQRRRGGLDKRQVDQIIKRVEQSTDRFVGAFDNSLDNSRLNGTKREDKLNGRAKDLESATDELRREFDRRDTWQENKDEVRKCLNIASDIDGVVRRRNLGGKTESIWSEVRSELNALARAYNLPNIGGSYK